MDKIFYVGTLIINEVDFKIYFFSESIIQIIKFIRLFDIKNIKLVLNQSCVNMYMVYTLTKHFILFLFFLLKF